MEQVLDTVEALGVESEVSLTELQVQKMVKMINERKRLDEALTDVQEFIKRNEQVQSDFIDIILDANNVKKASDLHLDIDKKTLTFNKVA